MFDNIMVVHLIDRGKGKPLGNVSKYQKGNQRWSETRYTGKTKKNKAKKQTQKTQQYMVDSKHK